VGIMKDTVTLCCINLVIYAFYFTLFKRKFKWGLFLVILICSYLIINLKAYVILAFIPGLVLGMYVMFTKSIESKVLRWVTGPAVFAILMVGAYFSLSLISESTDKYSADSLKYQVKGFHTWHTDVGGSTYNLGDIDYTPSGVVSKIPAALNVTFFRPYLWEARNPVVAVGALESLFFLIFFLLAFARHRLKIFRRIREVPLIYAFFIYCLVFGFAVGFTSYNFGALARYKIPIMSLFTFIILFLYFQKSLKTNGKT
jgi:hypothetical protein